jgi:hypothetical protein
VRVVTYILTAAALGALAVACVAIFRGTGCLDLLLCGLTLAALAWCGEAADRAREVQT